jgi:hypothetical protein
LNRSQELCGRIEAALVRDRMTRFLNPDAAKLLSMAVLHDDDASVDSITEHTFETERKGCSGLAHAKH